MEIVKAAALGISAVLLALQFKQIKEEYGIYIGLAAGLAIFGLALSKVSVVAEGIEKAAALIECRFEIYKAFNKSCRYFIYLRIFLQPLP